MEYKKAYAVLLNDADDSKQRKPPSPSQNSRVQWGMTGPPAENSEEWLQFAQPVKETISHSKSQKASFSPDKQYLWVEVMTRVSRQLMLLTQGDPIADFLALKSC